MTRGIVIISDGKDSEILYSASDSYPTALGRSLVEFCDSNSGTVMSLTELSFHLMKSIPGLDFYRMPEDPGLDFVYTMKLKGGICPKDLQFQHVNSNGNFSCRIPTDLSKPENVRMVVEENDRESNAYWTRQKELNESILPCPHCERKGWTAYSPHHAFSPKGEKVHCFIDHCPGHSVTEWHDTFEEAIDEWNTWVRKERQRLHDGTFSASPRRGHRA